jgi:hypothetical protein
MKPSLDTNVPSLDIPVEMRDRALKQTAEVLRKIDEVRRQLELPVEQLPIVIETYNKAVITLITEEEKKRIDALPERVDLRLPLTIRSETRDYKPMYCLPSMLVEVFARPHAHAFRPEDLAIHGNRSHWLVHDLKVGHRSQFKNQRGPAPGTEFGPGGICEHLRLETCHPGMDLMLIVSYIGPEEAGEVFEATMVGVTTA